MVIFPYFVDSFVYLLVGTFVRAPRPCPLPPLLKRLTSFNNELIVSLANLSEDMAQIRELLLLQFLLIAINKHASLFKQHKRENEGTSTLTVFTNE